MKNKGLSTVVTSLLLIVIVLVAAGILYVSVSKVLNDVQYSPEVSCYDFLISKPIEILSSCYNTGTNQIEIKIKRNYGQKIFNNIEFLFTYLDNTNNQKSSVWKCGEMMCGCTIPTEGEVKSYYFDLKEFQINQLKVTSKVNGCQLEEKEINSC